MTQEELKMELEELAVRFSEGWHKGIKIDASDIMLLNKAAQALAQPEQEPHGWYIDGYGAVIGTAEPKSVRVGEWLPWYTTPPQRTWVGLTDKDWNRSKHNYDFQKGVDWAELILKEKNT